MSLTKKLSLKDLSATKKLIGAFAIVVAVMLGVSGVTGWSLSTIRDTVDENEFSNEVIAGLDALELGLANQEKGLRGYLLTAADSSLAPYRAGDEQYRSSLQAVRDLLVINPEQTERLKALDALVESWRSGSAERLIQLASDPATYEQALQLERRGEGAASMERAVALVEEIQQIEREFLTARAARAEAAFDTGLMTLTIGGIVSVVIGVLFAWILGTSIARPVVAMTSAMRRLSEGDKSVEIPAQGRKDEVGQMAAAVEVFRQKMIEAARLEAEQATEREARERRAQQIERLTHEFDEAVSSVLSHVAAATSQMQSTSGSMSATAEETNRQALTVAAASEQASANVQSVASASDQLSTSIEEISRQVAQSASISHRASEDAERTNDQVVRLSAAAQRIGDVVSLIQDIAAQTNLLALNATIEAARAGEAGKGFAVVASEVKTLANQTAKATEEIAQQIGEIQGETSGAVAAIEAIGRTISEINQIASGIASAVEEQNAATREIARNVQEAARGTQEVSSNINGVTEAAGETGTAAEQVNASAANLADQSAHLRQAVEDFLAGVRAA